MPRRSSADLRLPKARHTAACDCQDPGRHRGADPLPQLCDWPAIKAADRVVELRVGVTENVHGELARTMVTVTADGVDLIPAQARRLVDYLLKAVDVAEREVRGA